MQESCFDSLWQVLGYRTLINLWQFCLFSDNTECRKVSFVLINDSSNYLELSSRCFQVPDSSFSVKLNIDFFPSKFLNSTVEIFGEVRLYDSTSEKCDIELESAHSLIEKLRKCQMNLESSRGLPARPPSGTNDASLNYAVKRKLQNEIVGFRLRYKPVIQVSSIRHISEAKEVIVENLRWRQLQSVRKRRLKLRWTKLVLLSPSWTTVLFHTFMFYKLK